MFTSRRWLLLLAAMPIAACNDTGAATNQSPPPSTSTADTTVPVDGVERGADIGTVPPSAVPTESSSTATSSASTSTSTSTATSTVSSVGEPDQSDVAVGDAPSDTTGDVGDAGDLGADEDPSFELGPDIVLDVDVARFPVDDAGVGGTGGAPVGDPPVDGPSGVPTGWAGFDASLEAALTRPGNTAASVAVLIGGEVVHAAAFGDRDPAVADPAEPQDRFRVASISKTITAIVAMQLVEEGRIGLDEPIGQLVADHIGAGPIGSSRSLTMRQLLTHRSGFGKYQSTFFRGGAADCVGAARTGLRSGAAGGGYVYSNMNYCIAGLAIEALTGQTYEQAVYRNLLTPLGISGMRLAPTIDPGPNETQHVTTPGRNYMETLGAAGAWVASPTELVTIMDALDASTPGFKPLPAETVLQMIVPFGGTLGQRGYGYGVISYGANRFGHTGTIESTHAMVLNRGDGVTWALTVAGQSPSESTDLERIVNAAFAAGGFVAG